ncbi:hypothetical protein A9Q83_13585 [Alphaproteobacteria bacterium 46_93_T64]|nr:hypothetical protein A9Q83_13585 [Alphaproteobacteria bacterium 46_93_T64]
MRDAVTIVAEARRWIGVRWRHQGRSYHKGVDCIGLCLKVAEELDFEIPEISDYPRRQNGSVLTKSMGTLLRPISLKNWQQGDIALFREGGFPIHTGFLSLKGGQRMVIHAHARRRKVVEEALDIFGAPMAVYRLKEVS